MIRLHVKYVDGAYFDIPVHDWTSLDGQGIDYIEIGVEHFTKTSGHSIYWVYPEGDTWVMGSGPVGYGAISPEVVVAQDGTQLARDIQFMPDLHHSDIKLGWWWPDVEQRPIDGNDLPTERHN